MTCITVTAAGCLLLRWLPQASVRWMVDNYKNSHNCILGDEVSACMHACWWHPNPSTYAGLLHS